MITYYKNNALIFEQILFTNSSRILCMEVRLGWRICMWILQLNINPTRFLFLFSRWSPVKMWKIYNQVRERISSEIQCMFI